MEENTTMLSEVIEKMVISGKLKMRAVLTDRKNPFMDNAKMDNYEITLKYGKKQYKLIYSQGWGIKNRPDVKSVLGCLLSDIAFDGGSFEDFCYCYGYDTDSRKALAIFKGCEKEKKSLTRLFGDDLQLLLNAENDI